MLKPIDLYRLVKWRPYEWITESGLSYSIHQGNDREFIAGLETTCLINKLIGT